MFSGQPLLILESGRPDFIEEMARKNGEFLRQPAEIFRNLLKNLQTVAYATHSGDLQLALYGF